MSYRCEAAAVPIAAAAGVVVGANVTSPLVPHPPQFKPLGALGLKMMLKRDIEAATAAQGAASADAARVAAEAAKLKRAMVLQIEILKGQRLEALRLLRAQRCVSRPSPSIHFSASCFVVAARSPTLSSISSHLHT